MKSTVIEASNYPIPEDTLIPLKLESVEQVEIPFTYSKGARQGQTSTFVKWEWTFAVTDGEYVGLTVRGGSEPRFTSNDVASGSLAQARPWAEALLGRAMELGEELDTDDLIGLQAQGTVRHQEPRAKKDGEGFWFNVDIEELFPAGMGNQANYPTTSVAWETAGAGEPPF